MRSRRPRATQVRGVSPQRHLRLSPPMRPVRLTRGPSPSPPAPVSSGSSSSPMKATAAKGFKYHMSPMTVRCDSLVTAQCRPAQAGWGMQR
jgi:hypothetical protein